MNIRESLPTNNLWHIVFIPVLIALSTLFVACEKNHAPIITGISYDPASTSAGTIYTLKAEASDEDGDVLQYIWTASGGVFLSETDNSEVQWRSPASGEGESFSIFVSVTDGEFETTKELMIALTEPVLGGITGTVCFSNCKIPIEGVRINIADKETITDDNGDYSISDLISRKDTLAASKEEFGPKESLVSIPPNGILHYDIEMTSITLSTKAFGIITDQDGGAIRNAEIIVLNPNGTESKLKDYTDENGQYRILYVPHGEHKVVIRKTINEDYKYITIEEKVKFSEIEQRFDFVVHKISLKGFFTDIRDGQKYAYKTIGSQTWMVSNLAYLTQVYPPSELSTDKPRFYVYGYAGSDVDEAVSQERYRNYGVLYNWQASLRICPFGWHLPRKGEWQILTNTLYPGAGSKMRTTSGWEENGNGDNSSGFSALPGGKLSKYGIFTETNWAAYFQSSTEYTNTQSYHIRLSSGSNSVWPRTNNKNEGYSVRCIRDN